MPSGLRWWAGIVVLAVGASACSSSPARSTSAPKGPYEQPKVLASGQLHPRNLIHDGSSLFFLDDDGAGYRIYQLPDQGGAAKQLATTDQSALGANNGELYLAGTGEIDSMPGSGGAPAHFADTAYNVVDIAADASGVYWSESDSEGYGNAMALAKGATQTKTIPNPGSAPAHIALGQNNVYWVTGGVVFKGPKSGDSSQTLAEFDAESDGIAVDDSYVYWTSLDNMGTVRRVSKAGGDMKVLVQGLVAPRGIAVDANYVYFTVQGDGIVERVPKDGGTLERLAVDQKGPDALALGPGKVFWADIDGGTISSVSIP